MENLAPKDKEIVIKQLSHSEKKLVYDENLYNWVNENYPIWIYNLIQKNKKNKDFINPIDLILQIDSKIFYKAMKGYILALKDFAIKKNIQKIESLKLLEIAGDYAIENGKPYIITFLFNEFSNYGLKIKNYSKNTLTIDKEIREICAKKLKNYLSLLNEKNIIQGGGFLYWDYDLLAENCKIIDDIKELLDSKKNLFNPKFKNELERALLLNDSNRFKKLQAIYSEVSQEELEEVIELVDKHNEKVTDLTRYVTFAKTGEKNNYYTLYITNLTPDGEETKFLKSISIDLLDGIKKIINHYKNTVIEINPDTVKIKSGKNLNPINNPIISFGKYKGMDVLSLWDKDKNYTIWLRNILKEDWNKSNKITKEKELIIKLIDQLEEKSKNSDIHYEDGGTINNSFEYTIGGL